MDKEKRKYLRLRENDRITFREVGGVKNESRLNLDISRGGARFISDRFIKPNTVLKMEIAFDGAKKTIHALAAVKWIKAVFEDESYEVGVEFVDIDEPSKAFLKEYLNVRSINHP